MSFSESLPPYVHQVTLDKQLYRVERKYSMAEKKLQEQKEKERQNKVGGYTSSLAANKFKK